MPYRVLMVHNRYGAFSGEERAVDQLSSLLQSNGHEVYRFERDSSVLRESVSGSIRAFVSGVYSRSASRDFGRVLGAFRPDVVHIHNLYPLISPSVVLEAARSSTPIVMTLHNFRLVCPNGLMFTHGEVCERCVTGKEYWAVIRNCERNYLKSFGYALRTAVARRRRWFDLVSRFVCLTNFQKEKLIRAGLDESKIDVVPNFVESTENLGTRESGQYLLYVGRITSGKGIEVLLHAAATQPQIPVMVVGRQDPQYRIDAPVPSNVHFRGEVAPTELGEIYRSAKALVFPSTCFEAMPLVPLEAMALGLPVIASRTGAMSDLIPPEVGVLVTPGDVVELGVMMKRVWAMAPDVLGAMGDRARAHVMARYSSVNSYRALLKIYASVTK